MRSWTRPLVVWTSIMLLLGQAGCATQGVGAPAPRAATRERLERPGTVPTGDAEAPPAGHGWASGAGACIKDFVSGKGLDPTVIVMLPLVMPVCMVIGALDLQTKPPATFTAASNDYAVEGRHGAR